jgi:hypothetical protein
VPEEAKKEGCSMRTRPAQQEKKISKAKRSPQRTSSRTPRTEQHLAPVKTSAGEEFGDDELDEEPVEKMLEETQPAPALVLPSPVFVRRDITAPDGSVRHGWEMWIGDHCFGRADSKELLMASFQRLQSPPESFHWREVRNRMQTRGRPRTAQPEEERDEPWGWEKKEEPPLLEEGAEGFQELTWETPS